MQTDEETTKPGSRLGIVPFWPRRSLRLGAEEYGPKTGSLLLSEDRLSDTLLIGRLYIILDGLPVY